MRIFSITVCISALTSTPTATISNRPGSFSPDERVPTCEILYEVAFGSVRGLAVELEEEEKSVVQVAPEVTKLSDRLRVAYAKGNSEGYLAHMAEYTEILAASAALKKAVDAAMGFSGFFRDQVNESYAEINNLGPSWLKFCQPKA
ncbi:hypothetical protein BGZ96_012270 [Linnemannia gamsii]|uniref:Uncharacterized protein n=1 Tax=Linnemannia gamsii TaxID=64522 RepID=A0ABQ7JSA2_9FUNG|nr:hypothetical protein BGZ96_012270 [Linnemannia gamsii]